MTKKWAPENQGELENRLMKIMASHVGRSRTIGMEELFERVFGLPVAHRINDTRALRYLITALRDEGVPICSLPNRDKPGYYLSSTSGEAKEYIRKLKMQALKKLGRAARMERISLSELLGQMVLNMAGGEERHGEGETGRHGEAE